MTSRTIHILLIEGNVARADSLAPALLKEWSVTTVHTGTAALKHARKSPPNIVIFDASTMRSGGIRTCFRLRKQLGKGCGLIYVHDEPLEVDGGAAADVYLMKPFTARKLLNRIRAQLPANDTEEQIIRLADMVLYMGKRSIEISGKGEFPLTPKLLKLLEVFLRQPNEILTRKHLMEQVWQTSYVGDTRTLDVHIRWVREIIEETPKKPQMLITVRGIGYLFQLPDEGANAG